MDVVSDDPKDRQRDYEQKLLDYAEAKVAEYWIVDFSCQRVMDYRFDVADGRYTIHGEFMPGPQAPSTLLNGFAIDVNALFAVAKDIPE